MNTTINFGGFYNSHHDDIIERAMAYSIGAVDDMVEIDHDKLFDVEKAEWDTVKEEYSKEWLDMLNDETGTNMKFIALSSPQFYNYNTDVIIADISRKDTIQLFTYIRNNDLKREVFQRMKDVTSNHSGYHALYYYAELFYKENRSLLLQVIIDVIISAMEESCPFIVEDFYYSGANLGAA